MCHFYPLLYHLADFTVDRSRFSFNLKKIYQLAVVDNGVGASADLFGISAAKRKEVHIETLGYPILDSTGQTKYVVFHTHDITARKQAEEALKESERKYRELFNVAPAGIYIIDFRTYRITEINDLASEYIGYTRQEILDMKDPLDILVDSSKQIFIERLDMIKQGKTVPTTEEYDLKAKNGSIINVFLNLHFLYEEAEIIGARVVAHDITDQK